MADLANSTPASAVHDLSGSTPPGAGRPAFKPATTARSGPRNEHPGPRHPLASQSEVVTLAGRLIKLVQRESDVSRRLDMLERHELLDAERDRLDKRQGRLLRRIGRWVMQLADMKAPNATAAAAKGDVYIEMKIASWEDDGHVAHLAMSIAQDVIGLGLEAACLPQEAGGNFAAYHREILHLHDQIADAPTDDAAGLLMDRWGEIDRMAMADHPRSFADAIAALVYARREHHQFHIESSEQLGKEPCLGDRLVEHLLDGAVGALNRVVQSDVADRDVLQRSDGPATVSQMADLDFDPWNFEGWEPPSNAKWADLANPYVVTSRLAWTMMQKTKPELMKVVRDIEQGSDEQMLLSLSERLQDAAVFFGHFHQMAEAASTRMLAAGAQLAREDGEPEAQPGYDKPIPSPRPDRRAVAAYRQWLDAETRLLSLEMYPQGGDDAHRFVPQNTAANHYHFPSGTGTSWRDLPQPTSRAEAMCKVLGINWATDDALDELYLPVVPTMTDAKVA